MNNKAEIKIKLHPKHRGLEKFSNWKINEQKSFVYDPYLETTKLRYWFIALITQKCGKYVKYINRNFMFSSKTKILTEERLQKIS